MQQLGDGQIVPCPEAFPPLSFVRFASILVSVMWSFRSEGNLCRLSPPFGLHLIRVMTYGFFFRDTPISSYPPLLCFQSGCLRSASVKLKEPLSVISFRAPLWSSTDSCLSGVSSIEVRNNILPYRNGSFPPPSFVGALIDRGYVSVKESFLGADLVRPGRCPF